MFIPWLQRINLWKNVSDEILGIQMKSDEILPLL